MCETGGETEAHEVGANRHDDWNFRCRVESRVLVLAKELAGLNVDVIVTQANGVVAAVHNHVGCFASFNLLLHDG
jgi:hypothetical protein